MIYHHGHILGLAKKAYERSLSDEYESFVSITLSAMSLECYVNDFTHQSSSELLRIGIKPLQDLNYVLKILENSKASLIAKIETIHFLLTGEELEKGASKHQELSMLVRLRNELVHRKPESTGEWGLEENQTFEPHKFVKYFSDRGVINKPSEASPPTWSQYINKPEVAKWAYNVVVTTLQDIVSILPGSHFSYVQGVMTSELQKI